jgi:HK97 family phage portal protein
MLKEFFARVIGNSQSTSGYPYFGSSMTNYAAPASKSPEGLASVQRSISILSDSLCSTRLGVMRSLPNGGYEQVTGTPLANALKRLKYRDLDVAITSALISGNGFLRIIRGEVITIEAVSSHRVTVAVDNAGNPWYRISEDTNLNQPAAIIPSSEMIHLRPKINRENPLLGISPLSQIHSSLPAIVDAFLLMGALSKNLASPGLILATDMVLQKDAVTRLRDAADQQTGQYKSGGTLILSSGLKPVGSQVQASLKDQDLINALAFSTVEVSRVFGVPPTLLSDTAQTSFNTASELHRSFQRTTVRPLQARVSSAFSEALLTIEEIDSGLEICFDNADFGAGKELAETLSTLVNSGVFTVNEARNALGHPDQEGGDIPRAPMNVAPVQDWLSYFSQPKQNNGVPDGI